MVRLKRDFGELLGFASPFWEAENGESDEDNVDGVLACFGCASPGLGDQLGGAKTLAGEAAKECKVERELLLWNDNLSWRVGGLFAN